LLAINDRAQKIVEILSNICEDSGVKLRIYLSAGNLVLVLLKPILARSPLLMNFAGYCCLSNENGRSGQGN
jgi:hypothetical protein